MDEDDAEEEIVRMFQQLVEEADLAPVDGVALAALSFLEEGMRFHRRVPLFTFLAGELTLGAPIVFDSPYKVHVLESAKDIKVRLCVEHNFCSFFFTFSQELPFNTLLLVDAVTCCKGTNDRWGKALLSLLEVVAAAIQRPIAVSHSYRLGVDPTDPSAPPPRRCEGPCMHQCDMGDSGEAVKLFRQRLDLSAKAFRGLEALFLAPGAMAQAACLVPHPIAHSPLVYPFTRRAWSVPTAWRLNASRLLQCVGYTADVTILDDSCEDWLALVASQYVRQGLPHGVRWLILVQCQSFRRFPR